MYKIGSSELKDYSYTFCLNKKLIIILLELTCFFFGHVSFRWFWKN